MNQKRVGKSAKDGRGDIFYQYRCKAKDCLVRTVVFVTKEPIAVLPFVPCCPSCARDMARMT